MLGDETIAVLCYHQWKYQGKMPSIKYRLCPSVLTLQRQTTSIRYGNIKDAAKVKLQKKIYEYFRMNVFQGTTLFYWVDAARRLEVA